MLASWHALRAANFTHCGRKCVRERAALDAGERAAYDELIRGRYYNELVLERRALLEALPASIAAVYYPAPVAAREQTWRIGVSCPHARAEQCLEVTDPARTAAIQERFARGTHANLLRSLRASSADIPLLVLNLSQSSAKCNAFKIKADLFQIQRAQSYSFGSSARVFCLDGSFQQGC